VVEQCLNLFKTNIVQTKRFETSQIVGEEGVHPRIHPMVFNPKEGIMKSLSMDLDRRAAQLDSIYGLVSTDL
jgi:carbonic anhydrase